MAEQVGRTTQEGDDLGMTALEDNNCSGGRAAGQLQNWIHSGH